MKSTVGTLKVVNISFVAVLAIFITQEIYFRPSGDISKVPMQIFNVHLWLNTIFDNRYSYMRYYVYVIELSKKVFTENTRFRVANPQFNGVLQCLYVGMTSKTPAERFRQHKTGYINKKGYKISAYIVQKYGSYLRPSLYDHINQKLMTRQEALMMEEKLAWDLRRQGYAVWFN